MRECAAKISGPTISVFTGWNVNTGAFDPAQEIIPAAREAGAWVHVDGAFGLWGQPALTGRTCLLVLKKPIHGHRCA